MSNSGNDAGIKEKMEYSKKVKRYADRCLQLSAMHPECNYIIGRWYYALAELGKIKSVFTKDIIKDTNSPEPTFELASEHFSKAVKGDPQNFAYNYYMAAVFLKIGEKDKAHFFIEKLNNISPKTRHERELQKEMQKLKD